MNIGDFNSGAGFPFDLDFYNQPNEQPPGEAVSFDENPPDAFLPNAPHPELHAALAAPIEPNIRAVSLQGFRDMLRLKLSASKKEHVPVVDFEYLKEFQEWFNRQLDEAINSRSSDLVEFIKGCLNGSEDNIAYIAYLKHINAFQSLLSVSFLSLKHFTLRELVKMSEWLISDFEISREELLMIIKCLPFESPTTEFLDQLFSSNLGLALLGEEYRPLLTKWDGHINVSALAESFNKYVPWNLYSPNSTDEVLNETISHLMRDLSRPASPPPSDNPLFQSISFPESYTAPLGFYIFRYNMQIAPMPFPSINLFFEKDSEGKLLFEYMDNIDEKEKRRLIGSCYEIQREFTPQRKELYIETTYRNLEARLGLIRGNVEAVARFLQYLEQQLKQNCEILNRHFYDHGFFQRCLNSQNQDIIELILRSSARLICLTTRSIRFGDASIVTAARDLLQVLPMGAFKAERSMGFRKEYDHLIAYANTVSKNFIDSGLDPLSVPKFAEFHEFMLEQNHIHGNAKVSTNVHNYWGYFPAVLFKVDLPGKTWPSKNRLDRFFKESVRKARENNTHYRTTFAHYLCHARTNSAFAELTSLIKNCPDALTWKDSNGESVLDFMREDPSLSDWVKKGSTFSSQLPSGADGAGPEPSSFELQGSLALPPNVRKKFTTCLRSMIRMASKALEVNEDSLSDRLIDPNGVIGIDLRGQVTENYIDLISHVYLTVAKAVFVKRRKINFHSQHSLKAKDLFGNDFSNSTIPSFAESPLSERQKREVLGAIYHFKRIEFARMKKLKLWKDLDAEVRSNLPGSEMRQAPFLIIRQDVERVHAEIVTGHFTLGNHLVGVTQDSTGAMTQKIKSIVEGDSSFAINEEGDRTVNLTVEDLDRLLNYCKAEKGLNLVILPRVEVPAPNQSQADKEKTVRTRTRVQEDIPEETSAEVHKRGADPHPVQPKRVKLTVEPSDPEILPEVFDPAQKGIRSLGEIVIGKAEKDLDEMNELTPGKRSLKEISPEDLYIPGAARKKQKDGTLVADHDDPASFFKNVAFEMIQVTFEEARNANEIKRVLLGKGVDLPIEQALRNLPSLSEPFIFSNLYKYQHDDLKRILQLQKAGVFPLISYRMGLGKTYVYIELILQQLAANPKGIHMVVVPKSVLNQAVGDIRRGLANAKATSWRALWKMYPKQAEELVKTVLNSKDLDSLLPLLASLDHVKDLYLLSYFLTKTRDLVREKIPNDSRLYDYLTELHEMKRQLSQKNSLVGELVQKIVRESSKNYEVVEQSVPFNQLQLSDLILVREDAVVEVENASKKNLSSPFKSGSIVVTKYHQVGALSELAGADQLDSITLDEAQKVNRKGTVLHTHVQKLIQKQTNPNFSKFIVTATPLENSFEELCTLLELVNPKLFPVSSFNALSAHAGAIDKQVVNVLKPGALDTQAAVSVFVEYYRLKKILQKAVVSLTQKEAARRYGAKFPKPVKIDYRVAFSDVERQKVDAITRTFANSRKLGLFEFVTHINKILTHHHFENQTLATKSDAFIELASRIENGQVKEVIQESFLLRTLFDCQGFKQVFEEKKKGILIVDNIAPGELIRLAANKKKNGSYCKFYEGSLSSEDRQKLVAWFKEETEEPRLLILSLEAGGVGLNLPEADLVILATRSYNPAQIAQAQDRAFRFGHEGDKPVYRIVYENSLFSLHLKTIHKIKRLWVKSLFKPQEGLKEEFALWMETRVAEASKLLLNFNKDSEHFESIVESIQGRVNALCAVIDERDLQKRIEAAIGPSTVTKTLSLREVERIPMPYGIPQEDVALFTYAYQMPSNDPRLNALKQNAFNSWFVRKDSAEKLRSPEQNGFTNYRRHIQLVVQHMKTLDINLPQSFSFIASSSETLECKQWPESLDPSNAILLYQRQGKDKQPHFEALIRKKDAADLIAQMP